MHPKSRRWFHRVPNQKKSKNGLLGWVRKRISQIHHSVMVEPTWLEVNQIRIPVESPKPLSLRIVQLSDIHFHRRVPEKYIAECIATANAAQPDLIALTGDYIHSGGKHVEQISRLLQGLKAPLGTFAVLGNHDHGIRNAWGLRFHWKLNEKVIRGLQDQGIRVLLNELETIDHPGGRFQISGVDDLWSRRCLPEMALKHLDDSLPHVMLAHHPLTIHKVEGKRLDLMLSGHTHGGQIHSRRFGPVTLSRRMKKYAAGLFQFGSQNLYVNKGIGFGWKIRYNCRPEIAVFDLEGIPRRETTPDHNELSEGIGDRAHGG